MVMLAAGIVPVTVLACRLIALFVKVCAAAARTIVPLASGAVTVRVVPVVMPETSNCSFLAGSRLSVKKVATSGRLTAVTVAPKATVGLWNVVAPSEPATLDPIAMLVIDPDTPPVPMLTALVRPVVVAPEASPVVPAPVALPKVLVAFENAHDPEIVCPAAADVSNPVTSGKL